MGAMPDTGRGRSDTQPSERRIARRHAVSLELEAKIDGHERMIGIRDISSNGFMAETHPPLILNEQFEVTLPHGGATRARAI